MSDRADRLAALLPSRQLDLLLITALVNVRYMTGYTGSNGLALIGAQTRVFVTDFRYVEQAKVEVQGGFERKQDQLELYEGLAASLPAGDEIRLGFDDANITVRQHGRLRELLPDHVQLVPAGGLVEELRAVKEPEEIEFDPQRRESGRRRLGSRARTGACGAHGARARGCARARDARQRRRPARL